MEILIYLKTIVFVWALWACGFIIVRRICEDTRIQLLLPTGIAVGFALYIFLLNLTAYFIKGPPLFYAVLMLEILLAYLLRKKIKPQPVVFPQKEERAVWIISLVFWTGLIYYISTTGHALSGDWQNHTTLASLFKRGDFPIHSPFQPDRLSSYHTGGALILAALKTFTGASYAFLGSVISFIMLLSASQILQWILNLNIKGWRALLLILIPATALISFGNFMFGFPYGLGWPGELPGLYSTFDPFGAAVTLDALNLFIHRMLALSFFAALLPFVCYPVLRSKLLILGSIVVLLGAVALADESVFIIGAGGIILISLFTLFKRNVIRWFAFSVIFAVIVIFQGGLINEVIFSSETSIAKFLLYPDDVKGPTERFTRYRSYREEQESSKFLADQKYAPFKFFHFAARWQILVLFVSALIVSFAFRKKFPIVVLLIWLFFITGAVSLTAYYVIVPPGWTHVNGNRFLALSYQMSGTAYAVIIILFFLFAKGKGSLGKTAVFCAKLLVVWLILISYLPQFMKLFPGQKYNWFAHPLPQEKAELRWVDENLKVTDRIMAFMEKHPTGGGMLELAREVGIFTPAWYKKPETQGFEVSPAYLDSFRTLNPEVLNILKAQYVMVNSDYLSTVPAQRLADLGNPNYFRLVYQRPDREVSILKILPDYLNNAKNYKGTFYEMTQVLPEYGSVYVDGPPEITESVWRVVFLVLSAKGLELYYNSAKCCVFYNFIINVDLAWWGASKDKYDYLVLGPKTDPVSVCGCETKLFWEDFGKEVKVWKTI